MWISVCFFHSIPIIVSSGFSILSSCAALCSWIALFLRIWNGSYPFFVPESQTLPGPKEYCVLEAESLLVEAKRYKVTLVHVAGSSVVVTWHLSLAVVVLLLILPMFWCHPISQPQNLPHADAGPRPMPWVICLFSVGERWGMIWLHSCYAETIWGHTMLPTYPDSGPTVDW